MLRIFSAASIVLRLRHSPENCERADRPGWPDRNPSTRSSARTFPEVISRLSWIARSALVTRRTRIREGLSILRVVRAHSRIRTQPWSNVKGARPDQTIVVVLLCHVRAPASHAGRAEKRRVQLWGKSEHPKHGRGVQIDIGAKMLFAVHHFFEFFANWNPLFLACAFAQVAPDLTHHRHTCI